MFAKNINILVIDDMKTMRTVVRRALADLGYETVTEAENGAVAWSLLDQSLHQVVKPFDLIISDWTMPKMTGLELLKKVRAEEGLKHLPFLMVTAESEIALVKEAIAAGVSNYVTKPFSPDTIRTKLELIYKSTMKKAS